MSDDIYSDCELKTIQRLEYELLLDVKKICEKENIEYFLIGGTALGSIRHSGFIPWDDDIDIGMTRENYEKFLRLAPSNLTDKYELQTPDSGDNIPYFYTKIRINNTIFMEYCNRNINIHHGIYIDVFPFDIVPDDDVEYEKMFKKFQSLIRVFSLRQIPDIAIKPSNCIQKLKSLIRKLAHIFVKLIPLSFLKNRLYNVATKYNNSNYNSYCCLNFPEFKTEFIRKEDLYPLEMYKFENDYFPIPKNWDMYLKTHYGDYMKLPKESDRVGHRPYKVFFNEKGI
ncbi:LicD family protein [Thomasclavelia saccharogumia]|uniref:LicD family protein n=1 Tax=Thomasclavelia saccharogumia TaxID=341225 RepID=UPI00047E8D13|nr:LicD family protein [Thomasclavelia saccharogumia]